VHVLVGGEKECGRRETCDGGATLFEAGVAVKAEGAGSKRFKPFSNLNGSKTFKIF
jgi:hypothetical protein